MLPLLIACGPSPRANTAEHATTSSTGHPDEGTSTPDVMPDLGGCEGNWQAGALPRPWWLDEPVQQCMSSLEHTPRAAYDDCEPAPAVDGCPPPPTGAIVCEDANEGDGGRVSATCVDDVDCPEGMRCIGPGGPGTGGPGSRVCEAACDELGDAACVRCDMTCNLQWGACVPTSPQGEPCVGDCQCDTWCDAGHCAAFGGPPRRGICGGVDADCACTGGRCVDECCWVDGAIAQPDDAACG
ncbi:MAG: hypothetical protein K1X88_28840 [Nannocystaceae bacterium]|nr:hypothetical protein [Nannocystaceae bacterium]